jgi:hypothetical protein
VNMKMEKQMGENEKAGKNNRIDRIQLKAK